MQKFLVCGALAVLTMLSAHAAEVRIDHPAYDKKWAATVTERSVFYAPRWGAMYRQKWEELVKIDPNTRAVAIHLHGCGGLAGYEFQVATFMMNQLGVAVITPDFTARPGNKTGCPSVLGVSLPSETGGRERIREGIFTAVNSARLDARTDDVEALVAYVKTITDKPIILSGHSEGGRTVYHYDKVDPRIIGMAIHQQSCGFNYAHLWRLPTSYKTWQSLDDRDAWAAEPNGAVPNCAYRFKGDTQNNLILFTQSGDNHAPLNTPAMKDSFAQWVNGLLGGPFVKQPVHNEAFLEGLQNKYRSAGNADPVKTGTP